MYDTFFIIYDKEHLKSKIKNRFPLAKFCIIDENTNMQDLLKSAQKRSLTKMFWIIDVGYEIKDNFDFLYKVSQWDEKYVHVFKEERSDAFDGVYLIPKNYLITKNEAEHMFFVNKKEVSIVASVYNYDVFFVNTYAEYLQAKNNSNTELFYVVFLDLILLENFKFDYVVSKHMKNLIHVFKNGNCYDGIFITSKKKKISEREFNSRFLINRTEVEIVASYPPMFDIVFISYDESNADENYQNLLKRFPRAKRIHGVKGIHQAHKEAAKIVNTPMFWAVDGDAKILEDFSFDYQVPRWDFDMVHVWQSENPINGLKYGYGGVKLLPTEMTKILDSTTVDMTTSISTKFKAMLEVSNISSFNTNAFNTWKSAFRECVKLSSKIIRNQDDDETKQRLDTWCTVGQDSSFGEYAIKGAIMGKEFGLKNADNIDAMNKINDWEWLRNEFNKL